MSKIFIPANEAGDWKMLLADPEKQWKTGYSAKALAHCWQEANDFPKDVKEVFRNSKIPLFQNIELLLAFPEYKVPLPGGRRASQNDIFILAKGDNQLVSIMVEGKVDEPFGELVSEWKKKDLGGKRERLNFLLNKLDLLDLEENRVNDIRYQLLHRTASALIEAEIFNAPNALMLVHSFPCDNKQEKENFADYCRFLAFYGLEGKIDSVAKVRQRVHGIKLYFGWVKGDPQYLDM